MKKFYSSIMAIAVLALSILSCTRSDESLLIDDEKEYSYSFSIVDDFANTKGDTKASLTTDGVYWENGDRVGMFLTGYTGWASINANATPKTVHLYSQNEIPAGSKAYSYYPYSNDNSSESDRTNAKITLSKAQMGGSSSAMPMVGLPFTVENTVPVTQNENGTSSSATTNGEIHFLNLGSIIEFNVYSSNTTYQTEKVQSITFKTKNGDIISGDGYLNLTLVSTSESTLVLNFSDDNNAFDEVSVYQNVNVASSSDNATPVYMVIAPGSYTGGTLTVTTDAAKYTWDMGSTTREFGRNHLKHFNMNLNNANRVKLDVPYSLFTGDLEEGDYVIVYNGVAMQNTIAEDRFSYCDVTVENDVITNPSSSIVWHIAPSGDYWTIFNSIVNKYAAATSKKNEAQLLADGSDNKSLWTVSGSSTYDFVNKARAAAPETSSPNNKYLRYNSGYGFACYANATGGALSLYKQDSRIKLSAPASVSASLNTTNSTSIDVTFSSVSNAGSYVIEATPSVGSSITKTVNSSPATISDLSYSTEYTISVYALPSNTTTHRRSDPTNAPETVTTGSAPEGYSLITSLDELETGFYVIAGKTNNNYYAMPTTFAKKMAGESISVSNDFISKENGDTYAIEIIKNAEGNIAIKSGSTYLKINTSGTDFGQSPTAEYYLVSVSNGIFAISNTRYLAWRGGTYLQFGNYASITGEYSGVYLFKCNVVEVPDVEIPIITIANGTASISCATEGATIYYTTNGNDPSTSSPIYENPFSVSNGTVIKAFATKSGYNNSAIASKTVIIGGGTASFIFGDNISETSGSISGVTLSTAKNTGSNSPAYNSNSSQLRLYRYNSMTLSCESNITSIEITYDGTYIGSDTAASVGNYTCTNSIGTWNGSAKSVTITNTGTENVQMRITRIDVTYE